jgi:Cu-Zn family superoxide dismutase
MQHSRLLLGAGLAVGIAAAAAAQDGMVTADLSTADGTAAGEVSFEPMPAGVLVQVELTGLPPGEHGIHIHQTGACTPDFEAAGDHLAPDGAEHGFGAVEDPHSGDLPNVVVSDDGSASAAFLDWRLSMEDLLDEDGSAVIVHAAADDYLDSESAGDRIACGVVDRMG